MALFFNRCASLTCDLLWIAASLTLLCLSFSAIYDVATLEKSTATSGSGFHLLSCPKLFQNKHDSIAADSVRYNDIHLSKDSTDKLMTMLKESLEHARVLHAGGEHQKSRFHTVSKTITEAVKQQMGSTEADAVVDINVPRKSDNNHLCDMLQQIVDEQELVTTPSDAALEEGQVTISIMKLQSPERMAESILLRGARAVRNAPLVDSVFKLTNMDDNLEHLLEQAKKFKFGGLVDNGVEIA